MKPPHGFHPVEVGHARGFAVPAVQAWVATALEMGSTLYDVAAAHPEALEMTGRGPVYAVPGRSPSDAGGSGRWVVRRYRRGGLVAGPVLGDRHLRRGEPRPVLEARVSREVGKRGIPTPTVLAGAVYPAGAFYRADLVTEYIPDSMDLAALLFGSAEGGGEARARAGALRETGGLIARMAMAGIEHPDLNAGNVLLTTEGGEPRVMLLDLDRCVAHEPPVARSPRPMLERMERSLSKLGRRAGRPLAPSEWDSLRAPVERAR